MTGLNDGMGIEHYVALPYCPWSNGSVEVVVKDLIWTCRSLWSELQVTVDSVSLLAEYAINHRVRDILGDRSVVEVMTVHAPRTTVDLVLHSVVNLKDLVDLRMPSALTDKYCPNRWVSYMKNVVTTK